MAHVQSTSKGNTVAGTTLVSNAITTTVGNVVCVGASNSVTGASISDSKGNTWTASNHQNGSGLDGNLGNAWYCILTSAGSGHTFTITAASDTGSMVVSEFSGREASVVLDVQGGTTESSDVTSHSAGSVTTTVVGDDIWAFNSDGAPSVQTYTAGSGWTTAAALQNTGAYVDSFAQYRENQATSTYTNTATTGNAGSFSGYIFALKPAAGGSFNKSLALLGVGS